MMFRHYSKTTLLIAALALSINLGAMESTKRSWEALGKLPDAIASIEELSNLLTNFLKNPIVNNEAMNALVAKVDGLATSAQVTELASKLEINNRQAAELVARLKKYEYYTTHAVLAVGVIASAYGAWKLGWWLKTAWETKKQQKSVKTA